MNNMDFSEYISECNRICKEIEGNPRSTVRIAVLRSFVIDQLEKFLVVDAYKCGIKTNIFLGGYNQFHQEIYDEQSSLYSYKPDIVILAVRLEDLYPQLFSDYLALTHELDNVANEIISDFNNMFDRILNKVKCSIFVNNFVVPEDTWCSLHDYQHLNGRVNFIRRLNLSLVETAQKHSDVYIVDIENLSGIHGKANISDRKMFYLARMPYKLDFIRVLSLEYVKFLRAVLGIRKKCIVLDLDNTLWGGVIGEDGISNIKLGNDYPGNSFKDCQKELLKYKKRGILLAINSKNNYEDAMEVISKHTDMILGINDFASVKINWNDKVDNMKEISSELNISLDSMVFVDDSDVECQNMRLRLPEVHTVNLEKDITKRLGQLRNLDLFETLKLTDEDIIKTDMYRNEKRRNEVKSNMNLEDYLNTLDTVVKVKIADELLISRLSQLTQKTNQFNMTTKRYTEADIRGFVSSDKYQVYAADVNDRFGDYGITGLCIIDTKDYDWVIDTFLLSCRVLGRGIEDAFIAYIVNRALINGAKRIKGYYIKTGKNKPAETLYENSGFIKADDSLYIYEVADYEKEYPKHIKVEEEGR